MCYQIDIYKLKQNKSHDDIYRFYQNTSSPYKNKFFHYKINFLPKKISTFLPVHVSKNFDKRRKNSFDY